MRILKTTAIVALTLLFIGCSGNRNIENDLQAENLKGKVKSIRTIWYAAKIRKEKVMKGEITGGATTKIFNEKGYLTEVKNEDGRALFPEMKYHYMKDGRLDNIVKYDYEGKESAKEVFLYNQYDLLEKVEFYQSGELEEDRVYEYDVRILPIKQVSHRKSTDYRTEYTFMYNDKRQLVETIEKTGSGYNYRFVYQYDERGNLIEDIRYSERGDMQWKSESKYDEYDNVTEVNSISYSSSGNTKNHTVFEYVYDAKSNWTKKIEYKEIRGILTPVTIEEREITYYDK